MASSTVEEEEETNSPLSTLEEETRSPPSSMEEETRSPLERICQVLSSKTKNSDDAEDQGESLSNPVTSALQFRFKCDKCEQSFSSKGGCTNHKKRVHPTDDDLTRHWHTCEQCGKSFFYKKQYDNHVSSCTGSVEGDKAGSICICPMCPFTCFDKVDLAHHVVRHEHTETEDGDLLEPPVLEEAVYGRDSNGQYDADIPAASPTLYVDESVTDSVMNMNEIEPEITQSEKGTWQCPMCPIRCTEKDVVKAHMRDRHLNKVRKHICNICKRAFTHSSGLKQHVTRVHSVPGPPPDPDGAKFFKCGLCGKSFSLVRSLISHWPTHKLQTCSSLENFQCILCKAFFQLPSQLQDHFIKQHPQEATSGSLPSARVSEKRSHPDDPSDSQPTIKQEKLDFSAIDDDRDSARGMPGFLSSRQCQDSFDSDYHPTPNTRKMKATTSAASPTIRSSRLVQSPHAPKESDGDDRPGSHISSMSGSDSSKEPVIDGNFEDTEPTSSQSCASCMEKSGRLLTSCKHCGIYFTDFVMHTLHMGLHGQDYPFQCHHCGKNCQDKYNFFTHIYRESHM